jgi:hypothetical protein
MKTNFTWEQLEAALAVVNGRYLGNVKLIKGTERPAWRRFTLRVHSSKGPGAKLSISAWKTRRSVAACWHVHGDFFDALWHLEGGLVGAYYIEAGRVGRMRGPADNWQDINIGCPARPVKYSESCECSWQERDAYLRGETERRLAQVAG